MGSDPFAQRVPIDTARLRIRRFRPAEDVEAMTAIYADAVVMQYIPGGVVPADEIEPLLEKHVADNEATDTGFYALVERASGVVVGEVGFAVFETGERELGWTLAREFWGRGYATEAARACLAEANGQVVAIVDAENTASIRVAERIGLMQREERVLHGRRHIVFAALA